MVTEPANWVWYGGRPSLDFVNTRRDRRGAGVEYLNQPGDLAVWLRAAGATAGRAQIDDDLLAEATELREAIDAAVRAAVAARATPPDALRVLNHWLAASAAGPPVLSNATGITVLHPDHGLSRDAAQALGRLAADAAQIVGTDQRDRLRICPGPGCGGRFLDESPAGRRRWCTMAVCGNRNKASTHRQAHRPAGSAAAG
jgi:predicted RNA-binding Zn ribbon-like protein